jgi:periplasmic protein TonB
MTNNEILKASLLDIIFENRNKEYGAYALRNDYDKRLVKAMGIGLGLVLLLILLNNLKFSNAAGNNDRSEKEGYVLKSLVIEPEKLPEPEKPKAIEKPKVAQADYQPIKVVPDNQVTEPIVDNNVLYNAAVSNTNSGGIPDNGQNVTDPGKDDKGTGQTSSQEDNTPSVKIYHREPQFPGGYEALAAFMRNNLVTPEELEIGEKRIVKIKFIVGKDGSITDITILESPGKNYDKEVSRVVRRMPKWEPAIQNDINVAVGYVLPVTFMGVEE